MENLRKITVLIVLFISVTISSQQKGSTYFIDIPQIGTDASFMVLENNINTLSSLRNVGNTRLNPNFLSINQVGYNNTIDIKKGAKDTQHVDQLGKSNYYSFIDYYNSVPTNMNILQKGNGNSLHIYGTNSLMENIKIIQKSNYKTVTIKNR